MPIAIKTLGPLHIEDLEPHRFEDLVRQLLYDFRDWDEIEATGRSGGDGGFDIRAWERALDDQADVESGEDDEPAAATVSRGRQWLVQCKRERTIAPARIEKHMADLPDAGEHEVHGLLFVAACDFSKATRDRFVEVARRKGFAEARLWGRAEIEDQLVQPKNDHLLFAYCGFSLQMRRRSARTEVRSVLSIKRQLRKIEHSQSHLLLRDASDTRYPYMDERGNAADDRGRWKVFGMRSLRFDGLPVCVQRFLAYIDDDGERWDYAEGMNDARAHHDPWRRQDQDEEIAGEAEIRSAAFSVWDALPPQNKAWLEVTRVVTYDRIVALDGDGDEFFDGPHVYYVSADGNPFTPFEYDELKAASQYDSRRCHPVEARRMGVFARQGRRTGQRY